MIELKKNGYFNSIMVCIYKFGWCNRVHKIYVENMYLF